MNLKNLVARCGATGLVATLPAGAALAAGGTNVIVRVEGLNRTLLVPSQVGLQPGWITRYGARKGECPSSSGQGALDTATHHRWSGKWTTQFGPEYEITSILGETHSFSSKYFWEIFTDNVAATSGACELKLHRGEQLLFAAVPQTGASEYPLGLTVPSRPVAGRRFRVKVVAYGASGKATPLAGANVIAGGASPAKTNAAGIATLTEHRLGAVTITATKPGHIRAASVVHVVT